MKAGAGLWGVSRGVAAAIAAAALLAAGCGGAPPRAPVSERAPAEAKKPPPAAAQPAKEPDWRPKTYTVKKGDTLYSIALEHGLDYKELAAWNYIENPGRIRTGQQLRLAPPKEESVVVTPAKPAGGVEARPLGPAEAPRAEPAKAEPLKPEPARAEGLVSEPKALKLPYSEQNLALVQGKAAPTSKPEPAKAEAPAVKAPPKASDEPEGEEAVDWSWPSQGKVISAFTETTKGVDIAGKQGQPVLASAGGKVVYSGSGLRGYGKLIIIKHNKTYLSAYAHNDQLLVKEGQTVSKGQKIAEMGSSDADRVKLHFEIRRFGKPVDPMKYLPDLS